MGVFLQNVITYSIVSSFLIVRSRSGSFLSFTNFSTRLLIFYNLSVSVIAITLESRSWFIDRLVTAYSLDFLNFTSSTSFFLLDHQ